ncbi:MAG: hypothetical protein A2X48_12365 [Lentisphaerae bacterium GWF2_49_21]|nr:MAG: hypothetical protein A2X48_12365 [Lentisphaerae bacterium GWF2_49_21]
MPASVTLKAIEGPLKGREFSYSRKTTIIAGSSAECGLKIPAPAPRHLCLIKVYPPELMIEGPDDLKLIFVNGQNIRRLKDRKTPHEDEDSDRNGYELKNGDEIKLGNSVFKIETTAAEPKDELLLKVIKVQQARVDEEEASGIKGYETLKNIGKGSRGTVFLAKDSAGELVALKIMNSVIASNSKRLADFERKVRFSKGLKHKNIIRFHEGGYSSGKYYLVHEYCDGGTVGQLMASRGGALGLSEALGIMFQVLDGLDYMHNAELPCTLLLPDGSRRYRRGLLHRSVCPHNIFLSGQGAASVVKIGGFDIATPIETSEDDLTGDIAGNICFMTRKIFVDYDVHRAEYDVWAAAATLYNMLTGKYPRDFPDNCQELWQAVLRNHPVPIRERNPEIPRKIADVIDETLVEEPQMKYKSALEFKNALQAALASSGEIMPAGFIDPGQTVPVGHFTPTEFHIGDILLDRYEIKGLIGEDGILTTFRAFDIKMNIEVALHKWNIFSVEELDFAVRNSQIWEKLPECWNIIRCLKVLTIQGVPCIITGIPEGSPLSVWIRKTPGRTLEKLLNISIQALTGLDSIHKKGIVHQNIKPNIMFLTDFEVIVISGFELAEICPPGMDTVEGGCFTPSYCSPEQAKNEKISSKTDIWGWAVTVLEMFTGKASWASGQIVGDIFDDVLNSTNGDGSVQMPEKLRKIIKRCLKRNSAERPAASELLFELKELYKDITGKDPGSNIFRNL